MRHLGRQEQELGSVALVALPVGGPAGSRRPAYDAASSHAFEYLSGSRIDGQARQSNRVAWLHGGTCVPFAPPPHTSSSGSQPVADTSTGRLGQVISTCWEEVKAWSEAPKIAGSESGLSIRTSLA